MYAQSYDPSGFNPHMSPPRPEKRKKQGCTRREHMEAERRRRRGDDPEQMIRSKEEKMEVEGCRMARQWQSFDEEEELRQRRLDLLPRGDGGHDRVNDNAALPSPPFYHAGGASQDSLDGDKLPYDRQDSINEVEEIRQDSATYPPRTIEIVLNPHYQVQEKKCGPRRQRANTYPNNICIGEQQHHPPIDGKTKQKHDINQENNADIGKDNDASESAPPHILAYDVSDDEEEEDEDLHFIWMNQVPNDPIIGGWIVPNDTFQSFEAAE